MAEKQSILGRITQLAKANINALLDRAEDPKKMLDQLVRDYTNSIAEAEEAVAQTIGNLRLEQADYDSDVAAAKEWGEKAAAASARADAATDPAEVDKWNNLAKVALGKQLNYEKSAQNAEPMIASQTEVVDKLKLGLAQSKEKLEELKRRRDELVARQKTAAAQTKLQDTVSSINVLDPTSELSRFEDQIRREEALAQGRAEVAADSFASQFDELDNLGEQSEIEARLAALKKKP